MTRGFLVAALMFLGALAGATGGVDKYALWAGNTALRGANVYQRRVYPELDGTHFLGPGPLGPPYTQADFDRLAAWGANLVVISHPGLFTEEPHTGSISQSKRTWIGSSRWQPGPAYSP